MQKFQAKGGVVTTDIVLSPNTTQPFINVLDDKQKSNFHVQMQGTAVEFYGRALEDLTDINTPKINGSKVVYASYFNKTLIVAEKGPSGSKLYKSTDFGNSYTDMKYSGFDLSLLTESIYDEVNDRLVMLGSGFLIIITNNFSRITATRTDNDNSSCIIHKGEIYFVNGSPNWRLVRLDGDNITVVNTQLEILGGIATKDGIMYAMNSSKALFQSVNDGVTFTPVTPAWLPTAPTSIYGHRGTIVIVGGTFPDFSLYTVKDTTKAAVLIKTVPGAGGAMYTGTGVKIQGDTMIAVSSTTSVLFISTDGGNTWESAPQTSTKRKPTFAFKVENYALIYGTSDSYIVKPLGSFDSSAMLLLQTDGVYTTRPQPSASNSFTRKDYVDGVVAKSSVSQRDEILKDADTRYLKLSGGTLTGPIRINTAFDAQLYLNDLDDGPSYITFARKDVMNHHIRNSTTGNLEILSRTDPNTTVIPFYANTTGVYTSLAQNAAANALTRKDYVDSEIDKAQVATQSTSDTKYLQKAGGTMSGNLLVDGDNEIRFSTGATPNITLSKTTELGQYHFDVQMSASTQTSAVVLTTPANVSATSITYDQGLTVLVATGYLASSTDDGATWSRNSTGDFASAQFMPSMVSAVNGKWFIGGTNAVYVSSDNAKTWTKGTGLKTGGIVYSQVTYFSGEYFVAAHEGVYKSTDGIAWSFVALGPNPPINQYTGIGSTTSSIFVSGTGGLAWAAPTSKVWASRASMGTTDVISVFRVSGNTVFAMDTAHRILKSTNGGVAWAVVTSAPVSAGSQWVGLDYKGKYVLAGYGANGTFFTSADTGNTWKSFKLIAETGFINDVTIIDDTTALVCTSTGKVHKVLFDRVAVSPFRVNSEGVFTSVSQSKKPNAYTRKDYVDSLVDNLTTSSSASYVAKSGDDMTGTLVINVPNSYALNNDTPSIDLKNGRINGINMLVFNDQSDVANEGLLFPLTGKAGSKLETDYDIVRALDGDLFLNGKAAYGEWNKPTWVDVKAVGDYQTALSVDLNTVNAQGVYFQPANVNATTANHYPASIAGTLFVTRSAYGSQQEYTTFIGRKFTRGLIGAWNGTSGPWGEWKELYGEARGISLDDLSNEGTVFRSRAVATDLNDCLKPGHYLVNQNTPNAPETGFGHVDVFGNGASGQGVWFQQWYYAHTGKVYNRRYVNGAWYPWSKVFTSLDAPTASDVGAVPTSTTINGKPLSANVTLTASDVGAAPTTITINGKPLSGNITLTAADIGAVTSGGSVSNSTNATTAGSAAKLTTARTINGTLFDGTANITTDLWGTPVNITVGNATKPLNGSADVSFSVAEMAVVPNTRKVNGKALTADITLTAADVGALAPGGLSGTSTKLATARNINGTAFDGSANITTTSWGTPRTITIGDTGKAIDGTGNASWSLYEMGASPRTRYTAKVKKGSWSVIATFGMENLAAKAFVNIGHTRGNVVVNCLFLVSGGHAGHASITQLESHGYIQIKARVALMAGQQNNFQLEILDEGGQDAVGTENSYIVNIDNAYGTVGEVTTFTAGTTIAADVKETLTTEWKAIKIGDNKVYHEGFKPSASDMNAAPLVHTHNELKGNNYISGGKEMPSNAIFAPGSLRYQMLSNAPTFGGIDAASGYSDCLWVSSYTGNDVKTSNLLMFSKGGAARIGFRQQAHDAAAWGPMNEIYHTGNKPDATDVGALPLAGGNITGSVNFSGTGNVLTTIGGKIRSNDAKIASLDGNTYSFVTSPQDAHLCFNSYWDGTAWKKYDNARVSGYVVTNGGGLRYMHSDAAQTNPNQHSWRIYHEGDKPTTAEIGALPLTGGTMSGSLIINHNSPTIWLQDTDNLSSAIHCNSNLLYILRSPAANGTTWDNGPNGRHPMTLNLSNGDVTFSGNVVAYSDARLKKDVVTIDDALSSVLKLRPVNYKRIGTDTDRVECGFIAQELQEVIPEVVTEQPDEEKTLAVDYAKMVAYMAGAIQELNAKIEMLEAKLKDK